MFLRIEKLILPHSYQLSQVFDPRFLRANGRLLVDAINGVVELEQRCTDSVGDGLAEWLKRERVWTKHPESWL
jgi:hypothetical protein